MKGRRIDRRHRPHALAAAVFALLATFILAVPSLTSGAVRIEEVQQEALPDFDARATVEPSAAQIAAAKDLGADVQWNQFGTPSSVFRHGGFVATNVAGADSAIAARAWLAANKSLFRLASTDGLAIAADGPLAGSTTSYAVVFRQQFDGLVAGDGVVTVGLAKTKSGWNVTYASSSLTGAEALTNSVELTPAEGFTQGANGAGAEVSTDDVSVEGTSNGWTVLDVKGLPTKQYVRKAAFPTPQRGARAVYESTVTTHADAGTQSYRAVVDAETGDVLLRENLVHNAVDDPLWLVFPQWPNMTDINEYPWNYPSADVRDLWCWVTYAGCKYEIAESPSFGADIASKVEWDKDAQTNVPFFQTTGNNADAIERWVNQGARVYGVGHHAISPTRDYVYPWTNIWFEDKCNPANLAVNGNDIDAAMANLFAMHNRMHDFSYHLGFDERHWNAQQFNYGMGTLDRDAVLGNAQSAAISGGFPTYAGRDNANMNSGVDGRNPVTNMFLWQPLSGAFYAPCVDGDYDMGVIGHEYGHAIENRMIGKGLTRQGTHAGAMGEAFGDFDAVEYLSEAGFVPRYGEKSPFVEGAYVTGNPIRGIRNYDMSWPIGGYLPQPGKDPYIDPLNLSDYGYDVPGPEVHSDGEIWIAVQFDIRDLFLDRYPSNSTKANLECLRGERPAQACPGNRRWIQDYYDAMVLMPRNPTLLDARNAMLAADVARFGGANVDLLWLAFAERGFGQLAAVVNSNDTEPTPDFSSPVHVNSTLVVNAVSKDGSPLPVNANIFVGDYEARATPIADTNPATVGPNRDNVVPIVPVMAYSQGSRFRAYNFVANAPGYGHVRFVIGDLKPGEVRNVTIQFPTNYASRSQGAVATGNGALHDSLIDDTEATNWREVGAPVQGQQVVVKLGQGVPVTFSVINVSALIRAGENRFTALREFEVYACTAGAAPANPNCEGGNETGWKRILNSEQDAFPGVNPRPVAPDMVLRSWSVPTTTATHVRLVVIDNQCTGQESFQGDQDNDPLAVSDCRTGSPPTFPPRGNEVHAAELQVWSSKPVVIGAKKEE